jgi:signal transduction histidine kinase/ActR/RegA family two-component response regulator
VWSGRIVDRHKDKTRLDLDTTIAPIRDPVGTVQSYVAVQHDVTQQVAMEAHLRQSQKMESVGQFAGGIAHDFNNLLTVIQGNATLLLMGNLTPDQRAELTQQILQSSERASSLTRQLLLFSREQVMRTVTLDLNEVVRSTSKMLARILGEDVALHTELAPTVLPLSADAGMLEQVLLNLALNARDAMPGGGRLTIATGASVVDEEEARQNPEAAAGPTAWLEVADIGQGISAEVMPRIFEPFFTTKEIGKGTGLGLPTVHGIVKQHGGWITVKSQIGVGTAFRVFLPATDASPIGPAASTDTSDLVRGRETILLTEDEAPVRRLTSDVLRRCGYTVVEADSGMSALGLWEQHGRRIDLLFTDLVMPGGMSGFELARRLRADKPRLKVLFTSGYRPRAGEGPTEPTGDRFLQKPYSPQQLAQALRDCLDGKQGDGSA